MISALQPVSPDPIAPPLPPGLDSAAVLCLLLGRIGHAVCLFDPTDRVMLWNDAYLRFFPEEADLLRHGLPYAEMLRRSLETSLPAAELPLIERHIEAALARHRAQRGPSDERHRDGRWLRVETCRLGDGSLLKLWTDVTAERLLPQRQEQPDGAAVPCDIGFARFDAAGRFVMANRALGELLPAGAGLLRPGVSWRDHLRRQAEETFAPEEQPRLQPLLDRPHPAVAPVDRPMVLRRRDGRWLQFEERFDDDGGLFSTWIDVTARMSTESATAAGYDRLRAAIESMPEGFALFDAADSVVVSNARYRALMGDACRPGTAYPEILRAAAESGHFAAAVSRVADWVAQGMAHHRRPDRPVEEPLADGRWVRIAEQPTADGGTVSVVSNITEQKRREELLIARSARLEIAVDSMAAHTETVVRTSRDGFVTFARQTLRIAAFNPAAETIFGRRAEAALGRPVTLLFADAPEGDGAEGDAAALLLDPARPGVVESRGRRADGTVFDMEVSITEAGAGHDAFCTAMFRDITRRKRAERALRDSERRFRELIEGSIQGILIHRDFKPLFANDAYARIIGFSSAEEVLALPSIKPLIPPGQWPAAEANYAALIRGDRRLNRQRVSNRRPDGRELWLDLADRAVDWLGEPAVQVTVVDITSQVQAEAQAAEKSALLEAAFDAVPNGICMFDADLRVVVHNHRFAELWDIPEAFMERRPTLADLVHHSSARGGDDCSDPAAVAAAAVARLRGDGPLDDVLRLANGRILEVRGNRRPDGGFVFTYLDIADRKRTEDALSRNWRMMETVLANIDQGIILVDAHYNVILHNKASRTLFDLPGEGLGNYFDVLLAEAERGNYGAGEPEALARRKLAEEFPLDPVVFEVTSPMGLVIEIRSNPLAGGGWVRTFTDITGRKRAEAEIARKTAILEATLENVSQGIAMVDAEGRVLATNRRLAELYGIPHDAFRQLPRFADLIRYLAERGEYGAVDIDRMVHERVALAFRKDAPVLEHRRPTGAVLEIVTASTPDGGFVRTLTDITARKRAEEALRQSEARLLAILEASPVGVSITTPEGEILFANRRWVEIHGLGREDLMRRNTRSLYADPAERDRLKEMLHRAGGLPETEVEMRQPDGRPAWWIMSSKVTEFDGRRVHISWFYDATDRKRGEQALQVAKDRAEAALCELRQAQESLIQAEKMASLGQLVAGVAHEINTPIGITLTAASHLSEETRLLRSLFKQSRLRQSQFCEYLELASETTRLMVANIERAAGLIHSFKQVAVDQTSAERRRFSLRDYIHEVLLSLHPRLKKTAHQVTVDCPGDLVLDGHPGALSQVLSNLVINSLLHGYDEGVAGRITITVTRLAPDEIELRYSDDGRGIPAQNLPKIFDPFFTTRRGSGGSGLGLHIVYNLVTRTLCGSIAVESVEGCGAVFTVRFPRIIPGDEPAAGAAPDPLTGSRIGSQAGQGPSDDADR